MKKIFIGVALGFLVFNAFVVNVWAQETIDFEAPLASGDIVSQVFGDGGSGPILVNGVNPGFPGQNAAMIYDSSCPPGGVPGDCSGGDDDLGTPNQNFGGPGVGAGGASGPFANTVAQGNLLIVSEDLNSTDPDDVDVPGAALQFDFTALGTVTMVSVFAIDIERSQGEEPAIVRLFNVNDSQIGSDILIANTGDNGVRVVSLGSTPDVAKMEVILNGSGAIDDIVFIPEEPPKCSIGDFVWEDANGNGCQDADERPIDGVVVTLHDDCDGVSIINTTTTNADGFYEFTGLDCSKEYRVQFGDAGAIYERTLPDQDCSATDPPEPSDANDSDCARDDGFSGCITFPDPENAPDNPTIDCGYLCKGVIGDYVWLDANEDGCQDEVDTGIEGVEVTLVADCTNEVFVAETKTNDMGFYEFTGLCPGEYEVQFGNGRPNTTPDVECVPGDDEESDKADSDCDGPDTCVELTTTNFVDETIDCGKVGPCLELQKLVSGDGGVNFFDADECSDADVPFTVDDAVYELVVTNCGQEAVILDKIEDPDLGIDLTLSPTITLAPKGQPGDEFTFTNDAGQTDGLLQRVGACPSPDGEFDNTATVSGTGFVSGDFVEATDPACVKCGPCIDLLKEVSVDDGQTWSDANDPDCSDGPSTSDPAEYQLTITNCGGELLVDLVIKDDVLGIDEPLIGQTLPIGGSIILTKDDIPALGNDDLCPLTPGDPGVTDNILRNIARVDAQGDPSTIPVFDEDPACVKCEECVLTVDKKCLVTPAPPGPFVCDGKVDELVMIWDGSGTLQSVTAYRGDVGAATLPAIISTEVIDGVTEQVVTVSGYQPSTNDVQWEWVSDSASGLSEFHLSCSDPEMNGPEDCGTPQGDGKNEQLPPASDVWLLEGLTAVNKDTLAVTGVLDCTPSPILPSNECTFEATPVPGCKTDPEVNDLTSITFRYTGADCSASSNDQGPIGDKWDCDGVPGADPVSIIVTKDAGKTSTDKDSVNVGDTFTLGDDFSAESIVAVGGQTLTFHTSCSQPLAVGDVFGSLEVVGINGLSPGSEVTYFYTVTNAGDTFVDVTSVSDSEFGELLESPPETLAPGESFPLDKSTFISETTENVVTVQGNIAGTTSPCSEATDTVTVTVTEPTCEVAIQLDRIEDKKIKWKLSNLSSVAATIDTLTISWPGDTRLKKVKYDGSEILKDVLLTSPAMITSGDWLKQPGDRTVNPGDTGKTLEFEFDADFPLKKNQPASDFMLDVTFEQGCGVSF